VEDNSREAILRGARQLLALMIRRNHIDAEDVASAIFSVTPDLDAEFPALAARQLGWLDVPLLCTNEIPVQDSLQRCVRILINWNTNKSQKDIAHIYIREAIQLRPDLCKWPPVDFDELEAWIADYMASMDEEEGIDGSQTR
jgi:chorismate mutase